jgi:hypothetical protein
MPEVLIELALHPDMARAVAEKLLRVAEQMDKKRNEDC